MSTTQTSLRKLRQQLDNSNKPLSSIVKEELTNINDRTLTTLSLVQFTAGDVLQLTEDTTRQFMELWNNKRQEAAAQVAAQQIGSRKMAALFHRLTNTTVPTTPFDPEPATQLATDDLHHSDFEDDDDNSDTLRDYMSTATMETDNQSSTHARSPPKKRSKRNTRNPTLSSIRRSLSNPTAHYVQEACAHYDSTSTPDKVVMLHEEL
jgi:hypothetical protein